MRLAIMSFAHLHAEGYIHNLRAIPDVEMIGFADDNADRGRHFAELYNTKWFETYDTLLAEQPDGVIICSENANHRPLVELAAEAGVHVLSEKPLATSLDDAQAMIDVCNKTGVQLMTAFPMRFSAPIIEIKKLIDSGHLGNIYGCNATNQGQLPKLHTAYPRDWFVDKRLAGGGAAADHTVHVADLLRWFLGCEVVEVYAELNHIFYGHEDVNVETGGLIMLTFEDGTFASIDCSWSKPPNYTTWGGLTMELVAEQGFATVDAFKQVMSVYAQNAERPYCAYWGSDANQGMIHEFVMAIRESRTPAITGYDGYKAVEIVDAVYRSAESQCPIKLPLSSHTL
ncbi:MAG: Gfo/Idh/MocA family oxidoreductase [Anaerolineae bacterium]|nr:Gfo/Idh/MocA family oxidoreductase [Anaerolineae bacterium]